jgi:hypothetical protein
MGSFPSGQWSSSTFLPRDCSRFLAFPCYLFPDAHASIAVLDQPIHAYLAHSRSIVRPAPHVPPSLTMFHPSHVSRACVLLITVDRARCCSGWKSRQLVGAEGGAVCAERSVPSMPSHVPRFRLYLWDPATPVRKV